MSGNIPELIPEATITVGELMSQLCRWPDHAIVKFKCPDSSAELCFGQIQHPARGVVEIELHQAPAIAPVVPA